MKFLRIFPTFKNIDTQVDSRDSPRQMMHPVRNGYVTPPWINWVGERERERERRVERVEQIDRVRGEEDEKATYLLNCRHNDTKQAVDCTIRRCLSTHHRYSASCVRAHADIRARARARSRSQQPNVTPNLRRPMRMFDAHQKARGQNCPFEDFNRMSPDAR